jgi:hypothetical protein
MELEAQEVRKAERAWNRTSFRAMGVPVFLHRDGQWWKLNEPYDMLNNEISIEHPVYNSANRIPLPESEVEWKDMYPGYPGKNFKAEWDGYECQIWAPHEDRPNFLWRVNRLQSRGRRGPRVYRMKEQGMARTMEQAKIAAIKCHQKWVHLETLRVPPPLPESTR